MPRRMAARAWIAALGLIASIAFRLRIIGISCNVPWLGRNIPWLRRALVAHPVVRPRRMADGLLRLVFRRIALGRMALLPVAFCAVLVRRVVSAKSPAGRVPGRKP
jgi:hypothetical protein